MSEALHKLSHLDITSCEPTLIVSEKTDKDAKVKEDKQNDLKHKTENDACLEIKIMFADNEHKVCTDLWEHCDKALKGELEARSDFESMA